MALGWLHFELVEADGLDETVPQVFQLEIDGNIRKTSVVQGRAVRIGENFVFPLGPSLANEAKIRALDARTQKLIAGFQLEFKEFWRSGSRQKDVWVPLSKQGAQLRVRVAIDDGCAMPAGAGPASRASSRERSSRRDPSPRGVPPSPGPAPAPPSARAVDLAQIYAALGEARGLHTPRTPLSARGEVEAVARDLPLSARSSAAQTPRAGTGYAPVRAPSSAEKAGTPRSARLNSARAGGLAFKPIAPASAGEAAGGRPPPVAVEMYSRSKYTGEDDSPGSLEGVRFADENAPDPNPPKVPGAQREARAGKRALPAGAVSTMLDLAPSPVNVVVAMGTRPAATAKPPAPPPESSDLCGDFVSQCCCFFALPSFRPAARTVSAMKGGRAAWGTSAGGAAAARR
eukprot:tig00020614_g12156.t1